MYMNLLDCIGEITNKDQVISSIAYFSKVAEDKIDIVAINKRSEDPSNLRYFTGTYKEVTADDPRVIFLWVDSGYKIKETYPIYISFVKDKLGFTGAYAGTESYLLDKIAKRSTRNLESSLASKDAIITNIAERNDNFYNELISRLLFKSEYKNSYMLERYLHMLEMRLTNHYGLESNEFAIVNEDGSKLILNSALLDIFGNEILIKYSVVNNKLVNPCLIESKASLVSAGFSKKELQKTIKRVLFYNDISEIIFNGSIDDFDLENYKRLCHAIEERSDRYPESVKGTSTDTLCTKLIKSIQLAVKISQHDKNYIVPTYNIGLDRIQFMMPFHVNTSPDDKPELVVIVNEKEGFYAIMTVIPTEEALHNSKLFSLYSNRWLV